MSMNDVSKSKKALKGIRSQVARYTTGLVCNHDLYKVVDVKDPITGEAVDHMYICGPSALLSEPVIYRFTVGMGDLQAFMKECSDIEIRTGLKLAPSYGGWSQVVTSSSGEPELLVRQLFARNGCGLLCSLGDKARDAKLGLFHLSPESERIGRFRFRVVDMPHADGMVYVRPGLLTQFNTTLVKVVGWTDIDPVKVMAGEITMLKGMGISDSEIVKDPDHVDGWLPTPTVKYKKYQIGEIVELELYMAKRESDDHLLLKGMIAEGLPVQAFNRKLDYQTIFRMYPLFTDDAMSEVKRQMADNSTRLFEIFRTRENLVAYLREGGRDLETSETLSTTVRALGRGLPVQTKEVESLLNPVAEKVLPVMLPGWRFRAVVNADLKMWEINAPIDSSVIYKVGDRFTAHRSPNVGIEMFNTHVVGFAQTLEVSPDLMGLLGGDFDGDEITIFEGHLMSSNKGIVDRYAAFRRVADMNVPAAKGSAMNCVDANFRAAMSSVMIGFLDSEVAGVFADVYGYGQAHAIAADAILRCVDSVKHAEIVVPMPGDISRLTGMPGKRRRTSPSIYRFFQRKFMTFEDLNFLVSDIRESHPRIGVRVFHEAVVDRLKLMAMPDSRHVKGWNLTKSLNCSDEYRDILASIHPSLVTLTGNFEKTTVDKKTRDALKSESVRKMSVLFEREPELCAEATALAVEIVNTYREYLKLASPYTPDNKEKSESQKKSDRHEGYILMNNTREVLSGLSETPDGAALAARVQGFLWLHVTSSAPLGIYQV